MLSTTFFCVGVPDSPLSKQQQATGPYLVLNSLFFFHTGRCGSAEQPESFLTWHPNRPCKACKIPQSGSACKCETKDNLLPIVRHHSHGQNPLRGEVRLRHRTSSNLRRACQPVRWGVRVPPAAPSFCCLPNPNPTPERNCAAVHNRRGRSHCTWCHLVVPTAADTHSVKPSSGAPLLAPPPAACSLSSILTTSDFPRAGRKCWAPVWTPARGS